MDNVTDASNGTLGAPGFVQDFLNQDWVRDYRVQVRRLLLSGCLMHVKYQPLLSVSMMKMTACCNVWLNCCFSLLL